MSQAIALPQELHPLAGRIHDVDSHEMMPAQTWVDLFGSEVKEIADAVIETSTPWERDNNSHNVPGYAGDVMEIAPTLMDVKGPPAPGAFDIARRTDVMDAMGVSRQLMFPTGLGGWAMTLLMHHEFDPGMLSAIKGDRRAKATRWLGIYNDWLLSQAKLSDRIRPVPTLIGDSVEELMAEARRMIDAGIRAVMLPPAIAPGGRSPAHPDLEPFWTLLEEARCVPVLHLGSEGKFFEPLKVWRDAPAFEGYRSLGEFSSDPWYTAMVYVPAQNFVQTMVLGGVFVRHPDLCLGVIEIGAYWVGQMLRTMNLWFNVLQSMGVPGKTLPQPPSEFLKRHVRFSVFPWEDLAGYVENDDMEDVICFASDYPHLEGGHDMINKMYASIAPCGPEVIEKFFVTNGAILLPD
ncbi:MAG: amidohydrolase family protein [Novosphingobium sp.]|nr:amidohydrolase family protein [Novosphingobium sp.]